MKWDNDHYYLSELFQSIQGEGNCAGVNSLFVRFQLCNLTCSWCDTKYTWFKDSGRFESYTTEALKLLLSSSAPHHIIFTGGEPTIYRLDKLVVPGKKFHVETNGTLIPTEAVDIVQNDGTHLTRAAMDESIIETFNWVVSPKLSNSHQQLNEKSLYFWAAKSYCIFKFVVRNKADLHETTSVIQRFGIDPNKVYIGLEGNTLESQLKPDMVDDIVKSGYNFSPRLHVLFWGSKREK
jgi:7-carboxy-7-deazaguanine synthase